MGKRATDVPGDAVIESGKWYFFPLPDKGNEGSEAESSVPEGDAPQERATAGTISGSASNHIGAPFIAPGPKINDRSAGTALRGSVKGISIGPRMMAMGDCGVVKPLRAIWARRQGTWSNPVMGRDAVGVAKVVGCSQHHLLSATAVGRTAWHCGVVRREAWASRASLRTPAAGTASL